MSRATASELNDLHRLVASTLLTELRGGKASAELLGVARSLLRDNGLCGLSQTDTDRDGLRKLYGLLVRQLLKAMKEPAPSASIVGEVRLFLAQQGITKDLPGHTATTSALAQLTDSALPFTTH